MFEEPLPGVEGAVVRHVDSLPQTLEGAQRVGPYSVARPGAILRVMPGLATFLARDGDVIEMAAESGADRPALEALLHGALASALIHQRGELPLHGATLAPPGRAEAFSFVGPQGAGKSTLAFSLLRRGWRLVSDDLTRVTASQDGVLAWPGRTGVKLCDDACDRFGLDRSLMQPTPGDRDKYIAPAEPETQPLPMRAVVQIDRRGEFAVTSLTGAAAMALVTENTFRPAYIAPLGKTGAHMAMVLKIIAAASILRLTGEGAVNVIADRVERLALG